MCGGRCSPFQSKLFLSQKRNGRNVSLEPGACKAFFSVFGYLTVSVTHGFCLCVASSEGFPGRLPRRLRTQSVASRLSSTPSTATSLSSSAHSRRLSSMCRQALNRILAGLRRRVVRGLLKPPHLSCGPQKVSHPRGPKTPRKVNPQKPFHTELVSGSAQAVPHPRGSDNLHTLCI